MEFLQEKNLYKQVMNVEKATNWNTLYGIYHGNHMVDSLTDTVFFSDLLPERCPALDHSLDKDVWLTQEQMMELFDASQQDVSYHIGQIYEEGEQDPERTHKKFLLVRQEGNRSVNRHLR